MQLHRVPQLGFCNCLFGFHNWTSQLGFHNWGSATRILPSESKFRKVERRRGHRPQLLMWASFGALSCWRFPYVAIVWNHTACLPPKVSVTYSYFGSRFFRDPLVASPRFVLENDVAWPCPSRRLLPAQQFGAKLCQSVLVS